MAALGQPAIHTSAQAVPFPTSDNTQQTAALGTATVPSSTGVVVSNTGGSTNGGIYIHGDVQQMTLRLDAAASSSTSNASNSIQWTQMDQSLTPAVAGRRPRHCPPTSRLTPPPAPPGKTTVYTVDTVYDSHGNVVTQTPPTDFNSAGNVSDQYTTSTARPRQLTPTQYTGTTNGVVYADGNIGTQSGTKTGGLAGVVADNMVSNGNIVSVQRPDHRHRPR